MGRNQQFFHGTTFDLQGKDVVPGKVSGNSIYRDHGHHGQKSSEHAFATEDENVGWMFASKAGTVARSKAYLGDKDEPGRVRVHTVAPHPLMRMGVYHKQHPDFDDDGVGQDLKEWKAPAFRSTGTVDIRPGRQGTFPELNWNQFRGPHSGYASDMNHPTDEEIEYGHEPVGNKDAIYRRMERNLPQEEPRKKIPYDQPDLFSGKTVGWHAENDGSPVGDYHRNNMFGKHL